MNVFCKRISKIVRQDEGSQINVEQFTFHNGGETETYSTIGEMVESESLDIMYPSKLPDNVAVVRVNVNESEQGNMQIQIITNDDRTTVFIEKNVKPSDNLGEYNKTYVINGATYYIFEDDIYFATCYHKDNYYYVQANHYDELILIINNMKE